LDAVASLVDLLHSNGLNEIQNIFVQSTPKAIVLKVDPPRVPLPVPETNEVSVNPATKTINASEAFSQLPEAEEPPASTGAATDESNIGSTGSTGSTRSTGKAYHGLPVTNEPSNYGTGYAVEKREVGSSGHWSYIIRSHGGEKRNVHKDASTLTMFGLHSDGKEK
jgi:hypothetical protein